MLSQNELKGIELLATLKEDLSLEVKNAGNVINTPENQNGPVTDNTGVLYFSSLEGKTAKASAKDAKSGGEGKESKDEKKEEPKEESDFSLVYSSSYTEGKGWDKPAALGELINRVGYHTANVSFSKDGNTMYFTRTISDGVIWKKAKCMFQHEQQQTGVQHWK